MGGVDEALDDDVIDDGAGGRWCADGGNDELLIAVAVAVFVLDDIVDDDEELLPLSDAGPVCRSIMRAHTANVVRKHFLLAPSLFTSPTHVMKKERKRGKLKISIMFQESEMKIKIFIQQRYISITLVLLSSS
jgi:hypothetical protein